MSSTAVNTFYQAHLIDYAVEWCTRVIVAAKKNAKGQPDSTASLVVARQVKAELDLDNVTVYNGRVEQLQVPAPGVVP